MGAVRGEERERERGEGGGGERMSENEDGHSRARARMPVCDQPSARACGQYPKLTVAQRYDAHSATDDRTRAN